MRPRGLKILILEDAQERKDWFGRNLIGNVIDFATSSDEANELLQSNTYDVIFLDHDLEPVHYEAMHYIETVELIGTGVDTAKFIAENKCSPRAQIIIHSLNTVGSQNIFAILDSAGYNVQKVPYLQLQRTMVV